MLRFFISAIRRNLKQISEFLFYLKNELEAVNRRKNHYSIVVSVDQLKVILSGEVTTYSLRSTVLYRDCAYFTKTRTGVSFAKKPLRPTIQQRLKVAFSPLAVADELGNTNAILPEITIQCPKISFTYFVGANLQLKL